MFFISTCAVLWVLDREVDRPLSQNQATRANTPPELQPQKALSQADPATPLDRYIPADTPAQFAELYIALTGEPPDYDHLATLEATQYRAAENIFRKEALL